MVKQQEEERTQASMAMHGERVRQSMHWNLLFDSLTFFRHLTYSSLVYEIFILAHLHNEIIKLNAKIGARERRGGVEVP